MISDHRLSQEAQDRSLLTTSSGSLPKKAVATSLERCRARVKTVANRVTVFYSQAFILVYGHEVSSMFAALAECT